MIYVFMIFVLSENRKKQKKNNKIEIIYYEK